MALMAVGDKVVVRVSATEEKTPSGLILPATARALGNEGVIVSKGREVVFGRKGSVVVFLPSAGVPVKDGGVEYRVLQAKDVLCIRKPDVQEPDGGEGMDATVSDADPVDGGDDEPVSRAAPGSYSDWNGSFH